MKHTFKITLILISMFIITQIIGLLVVGSYGLQGTCKFYNQTTGQYETRAEKIEMPEGLQAPELKTQVDFFSMLPMIIISFIIAIFLFFILSKIKINYILRYWFFIVVILGIWITINSLIHYILLYNDICNSPINLFLSSVPISGLIAFAIAVPLAILKVFKRNIIVHNITELLIYPGIAAVFVAILNVWTIIILLIIISIYDIWAVWHSGIMQKLAKFQMNELKVFGGFYVPYASKKEREQIRLIREKYKNHKISEKQLKSKNIKISLAILGGGDIVFPIITAGVFLKTLGIWPAIFVVIGASIALFLLFLFSQKKKFYPAMPFLSAGIFLGMLAGWLYTMII